MFPTVAGVTHGVEMGQIRAGRRIVTTTSEDRILFPADGITKGDVIAYYAAIAPFMIPHLKKRRLTMQRFQPDIHGKSVFQKDVPAHFPDWVPRVTVPKHGGTVTHVVCDNPETLVYIANQGCLTPHVGLQRIDRMDFPDQMIFDLDPSDDDFEPVRSVAWSMRELLDELGLKSFLKTTGSRGLHIVVPLDRRKSFDEVRAYAHGIAETMVKRRPDDVTIEFLKKDRGERLFLDTNRNAMAQTAVPAYAVRALDGAPVAMPIAWDELEDRQLNARRWTVRNAIERVKNTTDPWEGFGKRRKAG
jgi:bifunctional non-homologous end joining protein LigD